MRFSTRRLILGAAVLLAGMALISTQAEPLGAADIPDDTMKALAEQDIANIQKIVASGKFAKTEKKALRSDTLIIAYAAQSYIGKSKDQDNKLATLRDQALKFGSLIEDKKNQPKLAELAKGLKWLPEADASAKIGVVEVGKVGDYDIGELMYQFRGPSAGGLGTEDDIKKLAAAKKLTEADMKKISLIAARTAVVAELTDTITTALTSAKKKEEWAKFNKATKDASKELADVARGGVTGGKKIGDALSKLDASCTSCHNVFKK